MNFGHVLIAGNFKLKLFFKSCGRFMTFYIYIYIYIYYNNKYKTNLCGKLSASNPRPAVYIQLRQQK